MSEVIRQETTVFLYAVAFGIFSHFFYDLIRAVRRVFRHRHRMVSVEDYLYWLCFGFFFFSLLFFETDGIMRGYVAAGLVTGGVLYHMTISAWVIRGVCGILMLLRMTGAFIHRIIMKIAGKICGKTKKIIESMCKRGYNGVIICLNVRDWKERRGKGNVRKKKEKTQQE